MGTRRGRHLAEPRRAPLSRGERIAVLGLLIGPLVGYVVNNALPDWRDSEPSQGPAIVVVVLPPTGRDIGVPLRGPQRSCEAGEVTRRTGLHLPTQLNA